MTTNVLDLNFRFELTATVALTLSCNIQNNGFIVSSSQWITNALAFVWLCATGAPVQRWRTMKRQESNYFNPLFIT
jgi:hypothetical protein